MGTDRKLHVIAEDTLTAPDLILRRYCELNAQLKTLTKEIEGIKDSIKHAGSYSTMHYVAIVEDRQRTLPPSLDALIKRYGETVRELCSVTTYQQVTVKEKGGA